MPIYRIYKLDVGDRISKPPELIECEDDQTAIEKAKQLLDGHDLEVWELQRKIARLAHKEGENPQSK